MATDNIFSGLKVVDFSTCVAAPAAAVILSDFGADVIKVEPPKGDPWRFGHKIPPEPLADDPYQWHLPAGSPEAGHVGRRVRRQYAAPRAQKIETRI
jgi:formyl-CoA transferase